MVTEDILACAQAGDPEAFGKLVDPYRAELHLHCYRILGSLTDAEDMLQETLLAAWRGLEGFEGRASLRAWLYRIATNRCLNAVRDAGRRPPLAPVPPFEPTEPTRRGEATWLQPYPDTLLQRIPDAGPRPEARYQSKEAVELAFVAALQQLPPRQTATLVLRDVLGFSTAEVAAMLDTTGTAVKGVLQRARAALDKHRGPPTTVRSGSAQERDLTRRFAQAFAADDIDGVVALLTDDAWLAMPPAPHEYQGTAAISSFLRTSAVWRAGRRFRLVPTRANAQPAFGCYLPDASHPIARPAGLIVLTMGDDRILAVTRFLDNELLHRFGLPAKITLPA
ncbi:RNA polymerase subunit sigma-70 [Streptomyces sp. H39-S7]|uniref:RNA polymerase subunit sigma-70 n=1 Tax=Streptomyces sp. H39-S7 TaxID=3004357 RepID=UPI0022AF8D17|nr:RNA polymerase subunit sigma-70 [Streptomyces sp. H39-S7]MCZ4122731.1 RNA polymerase subunit sigma-70 [Streptomyces sp. H39-S7]